MTENEILDFANIILYNSTMKIVADTSAFLAVVLEEPKRESIIRLTEGCDLIAPDVLLFEIGNALSSLLRKKVLKSGMAVKVWDAVIDIPVELKPVDIRSAIAIADKHKIYAYDAYFLECASHWRIPLLTLDRKLAKLAESIGVKVIEVP